MADPGPSTFKLLAIDDQPEMLAAVRRLLRSRGFDVTSHTDPVEALRTIEDAPDQFDLVLLDIGMPTMNGLEFLSRCKALAPELPIIMLTGDDRAQTAVAALRAGAFNYLVKPLDDPEAAVLTLSRAGSYGKLQRRARQLERRVSVAERFETMVGASAAMRELFAYIDKLAGSDVNVLIRGDSGTGKELAARAIHDRSARARGPFVGLNCAALPDALIDSELFGHVRGSFTGAVADHDGVFVQANGGTLFLDEIGDIPPAVQLRLLRVLQEREVRPVGASSSKSIDVRVITATHVDLEDAVARGGFRADLFYRLNVVSFQVPALRDRLDDVPLLAQHLLEKHAARAQRPVPHFSPAAMVALGAYDWPGNVRELENAVQHALALTAGELIEVAALPERITTAPATATAAAGPGPGRDGGDDDAWADSLSFAEARKRAQERFERRYLVRLLQRAQGNISEAARLAGLDRSNFRRVLNRHNLRGDSSTK